MNMKNDKKATFFALIKYLNRALAIIVLLVFVLVGLPKAKELYQSGPIQDNATFTTVKIEKVGDEYTGEISLFYGKEITASFKIELELFYSGQLVTTEILDYAVGKDTATFTVDMSSNGEPKEQFFTHNVKRVFDAGQKVSTPFFYLREGEFTQTAGSAYRVNAKIALNDRVGVKKIIITPYLNERKLVENGIEMFLSGKTENFDFTFFNDSFPVTTDITYKVVKA